MKRIGWLLGGFLILGALAVYAFLHPTDSATERLNKERTFFVKNTDQIAKVFLAFRDGETVTLQREGAIWRYNKKYVARPNAIDNLLDAIRRIEIKFKPSKAALPQMVSNLATDGIKVELYDQKSNLLRAYYVGGGTQDERGTYVINEGYNQPYVAHLPGWEGNLRFRYSLKGEDWRDNSIFQENPEQIQSVSIEYPKQKNKSFRLEKTAEGYAVMPFYSITPQIKKPTAPGKVEAFLIGFEHIQAEGFENGNPGRDSVNQLVPFSIITTTNQQGSKKWVKLYPIVNQGAEDPKTGKLLGGQSVERYLAEINTGDFMLVQDRVFRKLLWGYDFFF
jgi:hypothetical protein